MRTLRRKFPLRPAGEGTGSPHPSVKICTLTPFPSGIAKLIKDELEKLHVEQERVLPAQQWEVARQRGPRIDTWFRENETAAVASSGLDAASQAKQLWQRRGKLAAKLYSEYGTLSPNTQFNFPLFLAVCISFISLCIAFSSGR